MDPLCGSAIDCHMIVSSDLSEVVSAWCSGADAVLYQGDCRDLLAAMPDTSVALSVTSPPYFMGKEYDRSYNVDDFISDHELIAPDIARICTLDGSVCWQIGNHVEELKLTPLDFLVHGVFDRLTTLTLRNRIIWTFGHGAHERNRFSGRYETILWYSKSDQYCFDLDAVRVPQKYPGKRAYKGPHKGKLSGNPLGKNPSDVWEIPNVKAAHIEKTDHPCQFPVGLVQRLVRALTPHGATILDPFSGSGSSAIAALMEGRRFVGAELDAGYCKIAEHRVDQLRAGSLKTRPYDRVVYVPTGTEAVAQKPDHFWRQEELQSGEEGYQKTR